MPTITLENLIKCNGNIAVLHGVDPDMADAEFTMLLGPSGSGKSCHADSA